MVDFVGRGERLVGQILQQLLSIQDEEIFSQYPIERLISQEDFNFLDPIFQKHKFDFYIDAPTCECVVEVNYKHGAKAVQKWNDVFLPLLKKIACPAVVINDWECENLFKADSEMLHEITWIDYVDVINSLQAAGIKPYYL